MKDFGDRLGRKVARLFRRSSGPQRSADRNVALLLEAGRKEVTRRLSPNLFRFGFICYPAAESPQGDRTWSLIAQSWRSLRAGELIIRYHPETQVDHHVQGGTEVILIGQAYHAGPKPYDNLLSYIAATDDDGVIDLLDDLCGRFALLVLRGGKAEIFHDPLGTRSVFYKAGGTVCVASHASLIAHAFGVPPRRDSVDFLTSNVYRRLPHIRYLPGDLTVYQGIYGLTPNNSFDLRSGATVRYWPRRKRRRSTFDDFFSAMDGAFAGLASVLGPYRSIIGCTGGIDSRTIIAALAHYGIKLRGVTWGSQTEKKEYPIIEALVAHLSMKYDWVISLPNGRDADTAIANAGYVDDRIGVTTAMQQRFRWVSNPIFVSGVGGEVIRGHYRQHSAKPMEVLSAEDMSRLYVLEEFGDVDEPAGRFIARAFDEFCIRANVEGYDGLDIDPNDVFLWEHIIGMKYSSGRNRMDPAMPSICGFNHRRAFEIAFGLEDSVRFTKTLFVETTRRYDASLADLPYC